MTHANTNKCVDELKNENKIAIIKMVIHNAIYILIHRNVFVEIRACVPKTYISWETQIPKKGRIQALSTGALLPVILPIIIIISSINRKCAAFLHP